MKKIKHTKNKCDSIFSIESCCFKLRKDATGEDPVIKARRKKRKTQRGECLFSMNIPLRTTPSFSVREEMKSHCICDEPLLYYGEPRRPYTPPRYLPPKTKRYLKGRFEAKQKYEKDLNFCKYVMEKTKLPRTPAKEKILQITIPSPEQSEARVQPRALSPTPSTIVAQIPRKKDLETSRPKSGIIINEKPRLDDYDSFDLVFLRQPRPGFEKDIKAYREKKKTKLESIHEEEEVKDLESLMEKEIMEHVMEGEEDKKYTEAPTIRIGEESVARAEGEPEEGAQEKGEGELTKVFRKKVEQLSKSTSFQPKDLGYESEQSDELKLPPVNKTTQKFRRGSEIDKFSPPPPKIKRGTLESHSFTKLHQPTLKDFYYGTVAGTMHQGSEHFPESIRNRQGLTMPVAAYCYAILKHPSIWDEKDVDTIIECGNDTYVECTEGHDRSVKVVEIEDLPRYCNIFDKKIRFKISEPLINGNIKSDEKNVYNLTKGVNIFFSKYSSGIFRTRGMDVVIWRDKYYYFFDAMPRTKNLYPDPKGSALLANFYDLNAVISVLLDRCTFGNWPFVMVSIEAYSILDRYAPEERESAMTIEERVGYSVMDDSKAVVLGSFDLADKCFEFTRNKQALPIAVISLIYSRISPPSSWFRKILDKIMIIGNQLYLECVGCRPIRELKLEHLPAEFTLGPYSVEIYIKPNVYKDIICKGGKCIFESCLEQFFQRYSMAIVELGKTTVAIWKQRGVFYCFDPYSRNVHGHSSRVGVACVSMHINLDSLTRMTTKNYCDKELIFYVHALVVCRIIREHPVLCTLPYDATMNEITFEDLKKSTKKKGQRTAVRRPIKVFQDAKLTLDQPPFEVSEDESLIQVDSNVGSLAVSTLPPLSHVPHFKTSLLPDHVADLDSPSLSDTQIEPPRIKEEEEDGNMRVDIDSYQLTMEELEGVKKEIGEGDQAKPAEPPKPTTPAKPAQSASTPAAGGDQKTEQVTYETDEFYLAVDAVTEIGSRSLLSAASANLSAELSGFTLRPEVLYPTNLSKRLGRKRRVFYKTQHGSIILGYEPEPDVTQSEELRKENNFVDLPDGSQLVRGKTNMADLEGEGGDMEYLAPFICIMATAVAKKFALVSWSADVVEYVMKCGQELYRASKLRYDQVSRLDIPKVSLGSTDFNIVVEYLFDTYLKDNILELALDRILFVRSDSGIFVTSTYSCAVFYRHHLYYLYDGYGNNEVGLSEGPFNTGSACLVRFTDLRSMAQRIIYNKTVREGLGPIEYSRFVISQVTVTPLNPRKPDAATEERGEEDDAEWMDVGEEDEIGEEDDQEVEEQENEGESKGKETRPKLEVGWKWFKGIGTIRGTEALEGRGVGQSPIKTDHFACVCACLMLIETPLEKWDSDKVDYCLEQGKNIYNHADDLCATEKRIIKNILIRKHFFDIIIKKIRIINYCQNKDMSTGIDTLFGRRYSYFLVQMVGCCNVIYKGKNCFYIFDPYPVSRKGKPMREGKSGWIRYKHLKQVKERLRREAFKTGGLYSFYTFEVTSIKKAPKGVTIGHILHQYELDKPKKKERITKPFFEEVHWLNMDPIPWSRLNFKTPSGWPRGCSDNMWHNWDIEYKGDLYSMTGNIHQACMSFPLDTRGKQTLCNLIMSIGMIHIYILNAWSPSIIDSVLVNGDKYCRESIKDISETNYELSLSDLKTDCEIFPYSFKVEISNVVDGTMFLLRSRSFNLYKALRYFFDDYERRFGIITVVKPIGKRQVAFGKTRELEYFMFDCESVGAPMFSDGSAVAYILRTTTLNRLLHVLTLTLRGGDFFIFEVKTADFKPIE